MDAMNITQQMVAFQKQSIDSFQSIWDLAQAQTSGTVDRMIDQTGWMPPEGRQTLENWRSLMNQERERFSVFVDQYFTICEKMLAAPQAAMPAKTKKNNNTK